MIMQSLPYQAFAPDAELSGTSAQALTSCIVHDEIEAILIRHRLNDIDASAWYPVQVVLDVFNDLAATGSHVEYFVSIGMAAAETIYNTLPESMRRLSLMPLLDTYQQIYLSHQRSPAGGDMGYMKAWQIDDDHIIMRVRVPYPDDIMYGLLYGLVRHFRPADRDFTVYYDVHQPRREHGGTETIIHIKLLEP
jgi:hypothetical protein